MFVECPVCGDVLPACLIYEKGGLHGQDAVEYVVMSRGSSGGRTVLFQVSCSPLFSLFKLVLCSVPLCPQMQFPWMSHFARA